MATDNRKDAEPDSEIRWDKVAFARLMIDAGLEDALIRNDMDDAHRRLLRDIQSSQAA